MNPAPGFGKQVSWVIRKDLKIELRSGETWWIIIPFGILALLVTPLATGTSPGLLRQIGPGMLWLVVFLFGMMVTLRSTALDSPPIQDLLRLCGLQPAAAFIGRSLASTVLLYAFTICMLPAMVVFYSPDQAPRPWDWLALAVLAGLAALGLSLIGSLVTMLAAGLRTRTALAPLLAAPAAIPVLLAGVSATNSVLTRGGIIIEWQILLAAMDTALAITGVLLTSHLEESIG